MNIIKWVIGCLCFFSVQLFAQEVGFLVKGTAPIKFDGKKVYLDYTKDGFSMADSVIIRQGTFSFSGIVDEPIYARMVFDPEGKGKYSVQNIGDRLYFYLGNETYQIDIQDSLRTAKVSGSALHNAYLSYLQEIGGSFMDIMDNAGKAFASVKQDASNANQQYQIIRKKYDAILEARRDKELEFAQYHPNSIFAMDALMDVANSRKLSEIEPIFRTLSAEVRGLSTARQLEARIVAEQHIQIGHAAPDFTQPDVDGKPIKVSDFKGQYVLIDFWASWCGPCRAENPNLLKAYEKYKSKGLEVLAVSLDDTKGRDAWLKAIKEDGLPWIHVADLKGWNNEAAVLYGVRAVPQNFLIDPQGNIIAVNLRGTDLHETLEKIFGGQNNE